MNQIIQKKFHSVYFYLLSLLIFNSVQADLFIAHADNQSAGRNCEIAIATVFQNEAKWLPEWIEFHQLIGVSHFYMYNNLSKDNYLQILEPYIKSGVVELFDYPVASFSTLDQVVIYTNALELSKGQSKWLAIIDIDEFVTPLVTDDLPSFLKLFPDNVGGIEINWQSFGTSNLWSLMPGELLIEKLYLKAPVNDPLNMWFKSIVRPEVVVCSKSAHECSYLPGYRSIRVTPGDSQGIPLNEFAVQAIRINHYFWRTKEFFYTIKVPRLARWNQNHFNPKTATEHFATSNKIEDRSIQKYIPRLKARLFPEPLIHAHGYWLGQESSLQHVFDPGLANELKQFLKHEKAQSVADFGCGMGDYVKLLQSCGLTCTGIDGNPLTATLSGGITQIVDFSQPVKLNESYDWVLSISVGKQIPTEFTKNFIENLVNHAKKGLILSWPAPNQNLTEEAYAYDNKTLKGLLAEYDFINDVAAENSMREAATLPWLKASIMVFRKK